MTVTMLSSLTRRSDLDREPFEIERIPKEHWATGDFVIGEITGPRDQSTLVELTSGRMVRALRRDRVIGALGNRSATLEAVGSWEDMTDDTMHAMTSAGLFGRVTSLATMIPALTRLDYRGHVTGLEGQYRERLACIDIPGVQHHPAACRQQCQVVTLGKRRDLHGAFRHTWI